MRKIAFLCMSLAATLGLFACSNHRNPQDNVLKVALKDDVKSLDPVSCYDMISLDVLPNIVESLYQYRYLDDQLVLEPLLAESMPEFSKDGLTVTVKIKKGQFFQDDPAFKNNGGKGREVKAADFIYEFKRLAMPSLQSPGSWIFENKIVGFNEFEKKLQAAKPEDFKKVFDEPIPGFVVKDDYTIEFKTVEPFPPLTYILAMAFTAPVAFEVVEAHADKDGNVRDHPVGTGPFRLKSWETSQRVVLDRNPNYKGTYPTTASEHWKAKGFLADAGKPLPFLDGIDFEIIKEEQPRLLRFEHGDIDNFEVGKDTFRTSMLDGDHLREDLVKKGIQFDSLDSLISFFVGFNMRDKLLGQNKYLRQAISSAIDRNKWIDTFDKYRGTPQNQVSPPGLQDRLDNAKVKYDYDLERAKQLLAKAGYPEGKDLPVLNFDFRSMDTKGRQISEMFVQMLGAIGIKVNPILNTFPAYLEKERQGNLQIFFGGWVFDYPDIENGYQLLYGANQSPGPNDSNFQNAKMDAIYKKLAVLPAGAKGRKELVKEAEELIQEESPWAYGYFQKVYRFSQPRVKNYHVNEAIQNKYKYVRIDNSAQKN